MDARARGSAVVFPISYPADINSTRNHPLSASERGGDAGLKVQR
jgi:hypothetical protein